MNPALGWVAFLFIIASVASSRQGNMTSGQHQLQARAYQKKSDFDIHEMLRQINSERRRNGVDPLRISKRLTKAALIHSKDQHKQREMVHSGSDGSSVGVRAKRKNYKYRFIAENIHHRTGTTKEIMHDFIKSKKHYYNMLSPKYKDFGAAMYKNYWTQVFGKTLRPRKKHRKSTRKRTARRRK
ncbi:hypothetical protein DSO57_1002916 [Entomophthora muscae]|uniref:Uncharacterized protein n=1 Tax=Entomophthora muscae TaxID=34485 RepID=A0ACC2SM40_9FUNG|nr:hypothetical protein DSO57_1002916 [Entomophthora muscae]